MPVDSVVLAKSGAKMLKLSRSLWSFFELNLRSTANVIVNFVMLFKQILAIAARVDLRSKPSCFLLIDKMYAPLIFCQAAVKDENIAVAEIFFSTWWT